MMFDSAASASQRLERSFGRGEHTQTLMLSPVIQNDDVVDSYARGAALPVPGPPVSDGARTRGRAGGRAGGQGPRDKGAKLCVGHGMNVGGLLQRRHATLCVEWMSGCGAPHLRAACWGYGTREAAEMASRSSAPKIFARSFAISETPRETLERRVSRPNRAARAARGRTAEVEELIREGGAEVNKPDDKGYYAGAERE